MATILWRKYIDRKRQERDRDLRDNDKSSKMKSSIDKSNKKSVKYGGLSVIASAIDENSSSKDNSRRFTQNSKSNGGDQSFMSHKILTKFKQRTSAIGLHKTKTGTDSSLEQ